MKLASLALVLGGTAVGTQLGTSDVHEEVHTKRLVLHSEDGTRTARISSDRAGLLIAVGDEQSLTRAEVRLRPEVHCWNLSFEHESGASYSVTLDPTGASQLLSAGEGGAEAYTEAGTYGDRSGMAFSRYHPGNGITPGEGCSIGAERLGESTPAAFLRLRRHMTMESADPEQPHGVWVNILQVSGDERFIVGPWTRKKD